MLPCALATSCFLACPALSQAARPPPCRRAQGRPGCIWCDLHHDPALVPSHPHRPGCPGLHRRQCRPAGAAGLPACVTPGHRPRLPRFHGESRAFPTSSSTVGGHGELLSPEVCWPSAACCVQRVPRSLPSFFRLRRPTVKAALYMLLAVMYPLAGVSYFLAPKVSMLGSGHDRTWRAKSELHWRHVCLESVSHGLPTTVDPNGPCARSSAASLCGH